MSVPGCQPLGRTGGYRLPDGGRVYAIGDVHGRADLLWATMARIDAHRAVHPPGRAIEICLGDLVDRGPESREVADVLMARGRARELVVLCGNHEEMLLQFLRKPDLLEAWGRNGGYETLASYGVSLRAGDRLHLDRPGMGRVRDAFVDALGQDHLAFYAGLRESHRLGEVLFVHAGIRPGVPLDRQRRHDLLWIREEFLDDPGDHGAFVVHGHTPVPAPELRPNRIDIDTGAYMTNRLTCLVMEGDALAIL